jgi:hypothetical protein
VKHFALLLLLTLPCAACGGGSGADETQLGSYTTRGWSLVGAYERAHKERNVEHALALVHLGSVDVMTRDVLIKHLKEDFAKELVSAELLPLAGNEQLEFEFNGRRVVPNLKVERRLHVEMRSRGADGKPAASSTDYFVGRLNGREMIASSHDAP